MRLISTIVLVTLPTLAQPAPTPCAAPGVEALDARAFRDAATRFGEAAASPACAEERERLLFEAAFALHAHAREARDASWCEARDAYRAVGEPSDAQLERGVESGLELTEASCAVWQGGLANGWTAGVDASPSHWWLTGSGIGALLVGGALVGVGAAEVMRAEELDGDLRLEGVTPADGDRISQRMRAEGSATGLLVGGLSLVAAGAGLVVAGLVLRADQPTAPAVELGVGVTGASIKVRFE